MFRLFNVEFQIFNLFFLEDLVLFDFFLFLMRFRIKLELKIIEVILQLLILRGLIIREFLQVNLTQTLLIICLFFIQSVFSRKLVDFSINIWAFTESILLWFLLHSLADFWAKVEIWLIWNSGVAFRIIILFLYRLQFETELVPIEIVSLRLVIHRMKVL